MPDSGSDELILRCHDRDHGLWSSLSGDYQARVEDAGRTSFGVLPDWHRLSRAVLLTYFSYARRVGT